MLLLQVEAKLAEPKQEFAEREFFRYIHAAKRRMEEEKEEERMEEEEEEDSMPW